MENIKGKVVLITGASSGIGRTTAKELAKIGAKVVLGARREERLAELAKEITNAGGEVAYHATDVSKRGDMRELVKAAVERFGKLDVLINSAGVSQLSRIDELDVDGWEEMIDINLKGVLYGMAAAIPIFLQQQSGHIINIISTSGIQISPTMGVYAATKNAVRTLSEAFRVESDGAVRITGISPGFVHTDFANSITNQAMREVIIKNRDQIAIAPEAIAEGVIYAISQPKDVEVGDIVIRPAVQQ